MILALYAVGGFAVGVLLTTLVVIKLNRMEENAAFRAFWMP